MVTVEELIQSMDEAGIDISVAAAIGWSDHQICCAHNDYLMEAVRRYPDRLIGLGMVQPGDTEKTAMELARISQGGLKGIGEFRPAEGFDLAGTGPVNSFLKALAEYNLVLMVHASEPVGHSYQGKGCITPQRLMPLIQNSGDVKIILAHWGGGLPYYNLLPEVRQACRNVYYDCAASPYLYESDIYRISIDLVGHDRIMFGSDYPLLKQQRALNHLGKAKLTSRQKVRILSLNAIEAFDIKRRS